MLFLLFFFSIIPQKFSFDNLAFFCYYIDKGDEDVLLDYTIESPEERKALVEKIIAETPDITPAYLETLADYLVLCMEKQEKKEKKILTENRMATINKRECSFEGLASQMENGEDGIYSLITENKNVVF
jgi:hypothetical protein